MVGQKAVHAVCQKGDLTHKKYPIFVEIRHTASIASRPRMIAVNHYRYPK